MSEQHTAMPLLVAHLDVADDEAPPCTLGQWIERNRAHEAALRAEAHAAIDRTFDARAARLEEELAMIERDMAERPLN